jgi:hypothetical protein
MGIAASKQNILVATGGSKRSALKEMRFLISYHYNIDKKMIKYSSTEDRALFTVFKPAIEVHEVEDDFVLTDSIIVDDSLEIAATVRGIIRYYVLYGALFVIIEFDGSSGIDQKLWT